MNSCQTCGQQYEKLLKCSVCKQIYYCGKECQIKDWKEHKNNCQKPKEKQKIDDYQVLDIIGEGNYTSIHKAIYKPENKTCALKIAPKQKLIKQQRHIELFVEKHCLKKLNQVEGVVRFYDNFQDQVNLYIAMEYLEGKELWELGNVWGINIKQKVYFYFYQIALTLKQLHDLQIIHRDIKPENIMVINNLKQIKFIDFGTAKDIKEDIKSKGNGSTGRKFFENFIGTPNYMPPECINNKFTNKKSDIFSLGGLLYFMISGFPPFLKDTEYLIFKDILEQQLPKFYDFLFTEQEIKFITDMMNHENQERLDIDQVLKRCRDFGWDKIIFEEIKGNEQEIFFNSLQELFQEREEKQDKEKIREEFEKFKLEFENKFNDNKDIKILKKHLKYSYQQVLHFYDLRKFDFPDIEIKLQIIFINFKLIQIQLIIFKYRISLNLRLRLKF